MINSPITEAMHRLCSALHNRNIDPYEIEIHLPRDEWWKLYNDIERAYRGFMVFDGRGPTPGQFRYMGIVYRIKDAG